MIMAIVAARSHGLLTFRRRRVGASILAHMVGEQVLKTRIRKKKNRQIPRCAIG